MNRWDFKWKAAIFDLDGTLVDSMGVWHRIDEEFLAKRGIPMDPEYTQAVKTMKYEEAADYTIRRYQLEERPEDIMQEWNDMALAEYRSRIRCKEGVAEFLEFLRENQVKIALATVSSRELSEAVLKGNQIEGYFDVLTDVTQVSHGKDEPDLYLLAAQKLGEAPEDCMVFEDVLVGIRSARRAGFATCGVADFSSEADRTVMQQEADWYINGFDELL